jgi:AcrR family transcriptional regulator
VTVKRRPGRRPGSADTRGEILSAARKVFAEKGFDKATVRGIAREAKVDPALVHHYFDTKDRMFAEAMRLPITPELVLQTREPMIALVRSAMTNDQAAQMFKEFVTNALLSRVAAELGVPPLRIEAAFAQMFGVLMARYVLKIEPMADADPEELIDLLAPTIQRYFVE